MDREILVHTGGGVLTAWVLDALRVRAVDVYQEVVDSYVEALREGAVLPPVQVVPVEGRYLLVDGRHRAAAWMAHGEGVRARVGETCSMAQAVQIALLANASHGHRRQAGDVTRCIEVALEVWPEESNRAIARRVGCCHTLVNRVVARQAAPPEVETVSTQAAEGQVVNEAHPDSQRIMLEPRFSAQTIALKVEDAEGYAPVVLEPRLAEAAWVEDVDRELAAMGPGRVLLASGEAEVPVVQDDADPGRRFYSGGTVTLTLNDPVLSEKLFAAVTGPKRHRGQDPLERWYTDPALATVCWRWLLESGLLKDVMPTCAGAQLRCLEPCVGGGAWVSGLEAASRSLGGNPSRASWVVMDADPEAPGLRLWRERVAEAVVGDFLTTPWEGWKFDVVIGNPPNSRAQEVVEESIRRLDWHGVAAFLLPASWMAAKRRRRWLQVFTPRVVALVPWRPSFDGPAAEMQGTGEGSPTQDYALHVWVQGDAPGRSWRGTWIEDSSEVDDGEE